jgi:hypothetical protein
METVLGFCTVHHEPGTPPLTERCDSNADVASVSSEITDRLKHSLGRSQV